MLHRATDARGLRVGEMELLRLQREIGVLCRPLLAGHRLALQLNGLLFVAVERESVLNAQNRANRTHVCPLRA
jgi:hypothetical protein